MMAAETPTIVLVHGAWADATGFDPEIRALRERVGFQNLATGVDLGFSMRLAGTR